MFFFLVHRANCNPLPYSYNDPKMQTKDLGRVVQQIQTMTGLKRVLSYVLTMSHTHFRVNPLYSCLNVKELLAWNRCNIWSLGDCYKTWTHNHLICKWTLNHLTKLTKWLSCVVSTYLCSAFDCMFLLCHICISEWIHTL